MKIGILKEGFLNCEPDVVKLVKEAAQSLREKGATVEEVSIPIHSSGKKISVNDPKSPSKRRTRNFL